MSATATVATKLDLARHELLDLGLRNSLLNYRVSKTRGVEIVDGDTAKSFQWLLKERRTLPFISESDDRKQLGGAHGENNGKSREGIGLQTALAEKVLQARLLATYYAARTHIEERGANILFLALGMLHWFEDDNSRKELRAPLLLVPVELDRTSAREKFTIKYNDDDIEGNLSLTNKLKTDFGIKFPDLLELEDIDVLTYFEQIGRCITGMSRWWVAESEISLGFFSFGKFLMYRDLASTNWCNEDNPDGSPILKAILQDGFRSDPSPLGEDDYLDKYVAPDVLHQVVDMDSSQALALLDVQSGRNLVIQGPPGTGKSQTITNIIADALGRGQKVLFVAEKMAALEVVKRRLDKVGLGDVCLELHSHMANKKALLEELRRTFYLGKPKMGGVRAKLDNYRRLRDQLSAYCFAVNNPIGDSGYTPYQVMGELIEIQRETEGIKLPRPVAPVINGQTDELLAVGEHWNRISIEQKTIAVGNLQAHLRRMGVPSRHVFRDSELTTMLPSDRQDLETALLEGIESTRALEQGISALSTFMGIEVCHDSKDALVLCNVARRALQAPRLQGIEIRANDWQSKKIPLGDLIDTGECYSAIHTEFDAMLIPEAWDQDLLHARQVLSTIGQKWWRFFSSEYRSVRSRIAGLCRGQPSKDVTFQLKVVNAVLDSVRLRKAFTENEHLGAALFGVQWQQLKSEWSVLRCVSEWMFMLYRDVGDGKLPDGIIDFLARHPVLDALVGRVGAVESALRVFEFALPKISLALALDDAGKEAFETLELKSQTDTLEEMVKKLDLLQDQIAYNNLSAALDKEGLEWVVKAAHDWLDGSKHLVSFFRSICLESLLRSAYNEREELRVFDRISHENVRTMFQEIDKFILSAEQLQLADAHCHSLPTMSGNGQIGLLLREFEKRARHMPIRKLMGSAGNAIQAIKPIFMMSPLSVATFLQPGTVNFDLVVFDEASQVKPVDAIGAILRGKQLVVVGDSKQLPPTSFFDALVSDDIAEEDTDESVTSDIESILGLMAGQGAPQRMLRWHYRSWHQSLIAFSNKEFYDSKLVVFPSPHLNRRKLGLMFHHLPNTIYDRGKSRTNLREAEEVAKAVMSHAKACPNLTLGVAAFSMAQAQAVLDQLERLRAQDHSAEQFFGAHPFEPFFVKNLESVQGDERDVIFISVGYGRDESGYVSMGFGALNSIGAERRLNVLITRARQCCEVFTNLTHADIDLARTQSRGVIALKAFLKYAQAGILDIPDTGTGDPDSPFEEEVAQAIRRCGHKVMLQVGSGGFRIDMAVVDPEQPGRYLLGIECDGATYHSARSSRDRDRLRQQVLEKLGWRIHRIWSKDWFSNPASELRRVVHAIEEAKVWVKREDEQPQEMGNQSSESAPHIERSAPRSRGLDTQLKAKDYEVCALVVRTNSQELHEVPPHHFGMWIKEVVDIEGPVHTDEVIRRIAESCGVKRVGNRIEAAYVNGVTYAVKSNNVIRRGNFLWRPDEKVIVRDRSGLPNTSKKIELISPEEIATGIHLVVEASYGIDQQDIGPAVCRLFGFSRTTEDMAATVNKVLMKLIQSGHLNCSDGHVTQA